MGEKMRILNAETFEHRLKFLSFAVFVRIDVLADFRSILDECTFLVRQETQRDHQTIREQPRRMRARCGGVVENEHLVLASTCVESFGLGLVLVRIHRIFHGGHRPHFSRSIP